MTGLRLLVAVFFVLAIEAPHIAHAAQRGGNVVLDEALAKSGAGDLAGWIAYGMHISNRLNETGQASTLKGRYEPSADVEIDAREFQARIWREMNEKKRQRSVYFDDLVRVSDAGFMREYVWRYYRRPSWREVPSNLRTQEFLRWSRDELATHAPFTGARVDFTPN